MAARSCSCFGTLPLQVCAQECHFSVTANVEAEDRLVFGHMVCAICVCDHSEGLATVLDDHASQASMYGVGCLGDCQDATVEVSCQEASLTVLAVLEQLADIVGPQGVQWHEGGIPAAQANLCIIATVHGQGRSHSCSSHAGLCLRLGGRSNCHCELALTVDARPMMACPSGLPVEQSSACGLCGAQASLSVLLLGCQATSLCCALWMRLLHERQGPLGWF